MSVGNTKAPNLPLPTVEYDRGYMDALLNTLRLYFAQLDNPGPCVMVMQRNGTAVISPLNFSRQDLTGAGRVLAIPSQADIANLRTGDVYYDSTAGNVLKVIP